MLDQQQVAAYVDHAWSGEVIGVLKEYITIPDVSPAFDPDWEQRGELLRAAELLADWGRARALDGMTVELLHPPGRTPLLCIEVPATEPGSSPDTVVLYGHLDKQPEMSGWRQGLGPWQAVVQGDRLYGRGAADDGYALFSALTAIEAVRHGGGSHRRCVVLIEASEESGSPDLPAYLDQLGERLGRPSLVIALDASAATYDRLWVTTSMRGLISGEVRVEILTEGVHSGVASGIAPSSFRILRILLDRVEDAATGQILLEPFHTEIPLWARAQAEETVKLVGDDLAELPFVEGARPVDDDPVERRLNATWRPALSYLGAAGLPAPGNAGNVLRPYTSLTVSVRLPPTVDPATASASLETALTIDPPYRARVSFTRHEQAKGWASSGPQPWLRRALDDASSAVFGKPASAIALGGTIPFMAMLGDRYPEAQFAITGVLGPGSNAHGPNEFLHLPFARGVTATVAHLLAAHNSAKTSP